MMVFFNDDYVG